MAESQSTEAQSTQNPTPVTSPNKKGVADFEFLEVIGKGAFGEVKKAQEKSNGRIFAAKMLNKNFIVESGKKKYVHTERNIFNLMNHPNIVKLYFTFQDPKTLYYLLELCPNGSLQTYLKQFGNFPEDCVRFYSAEIINALEHMHSKGVIHRDLKPDNVLLDPGFHSKLTDFGTSKELGTDSRARSDSFCGTEEFVPPELLDTEEPYCTKSSDLWALGVMVFLMISGKPPFKGQTSFLTFELIKKRDFTFTGEFSSSAQDLISKLLVMNPDERLGAGEGGYKALKSHPFFTGIDWENIHTQTPPAFGVSPATPSDNNNNAGVEAKKEEKKEEKKDKREEKTEDKKEEKTEDKKEEKTEDKKETPAPQTTQATSPSKSDKKEKKVKKEKEEKKKDKKEKKQKEAETTNSSAASGSDSSTPKKDEKRKRFFSFNFSKDK